MQLQLCLLSSCCVLNNVSCFSPNRHRPFACLYVHIWARCLPVWAPSSPQIRIDLHSHTRRETGTLTWAWAQANAKTPKDSSIDSSKSTSRLRCHRGHTHVVWHPHLFGIFDIDVDDVDCRWRCRCRCRMAATACTLNVIDGSVCAALRSPS